MTGGKHMNSCFAIACHRMKRKSALKRNNKKISDKNEDLA
jgi:hypothetical protein